MSERASGGPLESGYPPCHPQRKRLRTETTKTAVARPRGNAISIPGWSWGRLEPPAPWGQRPRGSSGQGAGLESTAWIPRPKKGQRMRLPQKPPHKSLQWGTGRGTHSGPAGAKEGLTEEPGSWAPGCAAPSLRGCQGMWPSPLCQLRAGTGGPGVLVRAGRASPDSKPHPLSLGESPQPAAYRPPPPPRRASAPPSAPRDPHAKPGDTLRARAARGSDWDRARGPGLGELRV